MCGGEVKGIMCSSSDLHFRVHTATDGGHAPGRAGSDLSVAQRGEDGLLVLVEGLQWGVLAWTAELESATHSWVGYTPSHTPRVRCPFRIEGWRV